MVGAVKWEPLPLTAPEPANNPSTPEKMRRARLFADSALSRYGAVACASCHDTKRGGGADGRQFSRGVGGQLAGATHRPFSTRRSRPVVLGRAGAFRRAGARPRSPIRSRWAAPIRTRWSSASRRTDPMFDAFTAAFGAADPVKRRAPRPGHRRLRAHAHHARYALRPLRARRPKRADAPAGAWHVLVRKLRLRGLPLRAEFQLREHTGAGSRRHGLPAIPGATFRVRCEIRTDRGFRAHGRRARSPVCGASPRCGTSP